MDENDDERSDGSPSTAAQVVGSTTGALVAVTPLGPLVGAALTPAAIVYAEKVLTELRARTPHSVAMLLAHTAHRLGVDPAEVQTRADTTHDGEALFVDSVNAASETIDQRKIAALAMALANGLAGDRARIDQERLMVRTLAQLEAPHIRLLANLKSKPLARPKRTITQAEGAIIATLASLGLVADDTREMAKAADAKMAQTIFDAMKYLARVHDAQRQGRPAPALPSKPSDLERWRRQREERDELTPTWRRTPFGDRCLGYLYQASEQAGLDATDLRPRQQRQGRVRQAVSRAPTGL